MAQKSFTAQLDDFVDATIEDLRNIQRESVQDVIDDAQLPKAKGGRMPVVTGFLRNSIVSGLNGTTTAAGDALSYTLTIAQMEIGDEARFAWTASYAMIQEMQNHFVGVAATKWPQFLESNAARLKR